MPRPRKPKADVSRSRKRAAEIRWNRLSPDNRKNATAPGRAVVERNRARNRRQDESVLS